MAIIVEREIARADMNDEFGVTVWQQKRQIDYTPDEARQLAREMVAAADEADRVRDEVDAEAGVPLVERLARQSDSSIPSEVL